MGVRSLYVSAASLLKLAKNDNINVRQSLYNSNKFKFMNIKSIYALVSEALRHWDVLETVIKDTEILVDNPEIDEWRLRIFIIEVFFGLGKDKINSDDRAMHTVFKYEDKIRHILSSDKVKILIDSIVPKAIVGVRYARLNTLALSDEAAVERLAASGWWTEPAAASYDAYVSRLRALVPVARVLVPDFHVPHMFAFAAGLEADLLDTLGFGSEVFIMDKSSCLAPLLLDPKKNSRVLDMCAAPGNKTILLASLAKKVYAVERDQKRFEILTKMVSGSGVDNVKLIHEDVTKINLLKKRFQKVEYILLDPTCSGSGMRGRQPHATLGHRDRDRERLRKLGGFQLTLLRFALTRFPCAKRVVYSTCSLETEENEEVVQAALESRYHNFRLAPAADRLPQWVNRGSPEFACGSKCVYADPDTDLTNGFFVAVFERDETSAGKEGERGEKQVLNEPKRDHVLKEQKQIGRKRRGPKEEEKSGEVFPKKRLSIHCEKDAARPMSVSDSRVRDRFEVPEKMVSKKKPTEQISKKPLEKPAKSGESNEEIPSYKYPLNNENLARKIHKSPNGNKTVLKKKSASLKKRIRRKQLAKRLDTSVLKNKSKPKEV